MRTELLLIALFLSHAVVAKNAIDTCPKVYLPNIYFKTGSVFLTPQAKIVLDTVVNYLIKHPFCKVKMKGFARGNYESLQKSWDRVYSVKIYFVKRGVGENRSIFSYDEDGDPLHVSLEVTNDTIPIWTPTMIPCLSYHKFRRMSEKRCVGSKGRFTH